MKILKTLILNAWFLALLLSIVVIVLLPDLFDKYQIEVVDSGRLPDIKNSKVYCQDLDHDGFSEKVYSYEDIGKHSLQVITWDGGMVDQWNLPGTIILGSNRLACGDYDRDGFDEVYTFYERSDTVFLYCIEPMDTISPLMFENMMVCRLSHRYAGPDPLIVNVEFQDINNDGKGELVFVINSGQARFPRNVFIYDLFRDTLLKSPDYGSVPNESLSLIDLDSDGKKEIYGGAKSFRAGTR
nr:hypothetical protein [Bacteroidota bacterium]